MNRIPIRKLSDRGFETDVPIAGFEGLEISAARQHHFLSHKLNYGYVSREIGRKRAVSRNANEFALNAFLSLSSLPINRLILGNSLLLAPSTGQIAQHLPVNRREMVRWPRRAREKQVSTLFSRR